EIEARVAKRMQLALDEIGPHAQRVAAPSVQLGRLIRREQPRLSEGVDPKAIEQRNFMNPSSGFCSRSAHLVRSRQFQARKLFEQGRWRGVAHTATGGP